MITIIKILCWLFVYAVFLLVFPMPVIFLTAIGVPVVIIIAISGR